MKGVDIVGDFSDSETSDKGQQTKVEAHREAMEKPVDVKRNRYPYCIVWTPLPLITYVIHLLMLNHRYFLL